MWELGMCDEDRWEEWVWVYKVFISRDERITESTLWSYITVLFVIICDMIDIYYWSIDIIDSNGVKIVDSNGVKIVKYKDKDKTVDKENTVE